MTTGTCYFPSYGAALRYYRPYLEDLSGPAENKDQQGKRTAFLRSYVDKKLNSSEIHIGKPDLKPGEKLSIQDNRYHITA